MNFCSNCGARVVLRVPDDDERPRFVCEQCRTIHYQNPRIVAGCIPEKKGRVLLCRRAIEPRAGFWTLPAGYMENGETVSEAAAREALEETGARVEITELFTVLNLVHARQVYMMYRAILLDDDFGPTRESLDVRLFDEPGIPWKEIAFSSIYRTLAFFFKDRAEGRFRLHEEAIPPMGLQ